MMNETGLSPQYDPKPVEKKWYAFWTEKGFFRAIANSGKPPFSIVIPPPNITGILHLGHVLNNTIQDILIRSKRMQGYEALWMPGTDHAGIATQVVVERMLARQGVTRAELGREKFIAEVWKWREQYGDTIIRQLKALGCSCDWERERFTMDEGLSRSVTTVFITLYQKGIIYRGHRIINWCPRCRTALSNEESIPQDETGSLWVIRYPLKDGSGSIAVATTRPETMLGDTAVAVHPDDERHASLIGKTVLLPLLGREIPIVADRELVDPAFGTGAVKVTPAHDPNDFIIGQRNQLPQVIVIGEDGLITEAAGPDYQGMDRMACRTKVVSDLEAQGLLERIEKHTHAVPHCQRCDTVLEPLLSRQWFAKMRPMADRLIRALDEEGIPRFTPDHWVKTYRHWLENIEDWCISRQLWWGHRIPVWYCDSCETPHASEHAPERCDQCDCKVFCQDEDVLDTWFSSALWPFSTLGWPERTPALRFFYPTSVLVTAHDILFFWVARMMMMGYTFMDEAPFREVYLNNLVRDLKGRKLSKSAGNSPDPLEVMDTYGTDALRFAITLIAPHGQDLLYDNERVEVGRNFANKLWNAARFVLMNQLPSPPQTASIETAVDLWDRWILSRLSTTIDHATRALDRYAFHEAAHTLYDFFWHDYCDWYLEIIKPRLYQADQSPDCVAARQVAVTVLDQLLRALHPFMPFITDELWSQLKQHLPESEHSIESLMVAAWPVARPGWIATDSEADVTLLQNFTSAMREVRADFRVHPAKRMLTLCQVHSDRLKSIINEAKPALERMAGVELQLQAVGDARPDGSASGVLHELEFYIPLADLVDVDIEVERLTKERERIAGELTKVENRLSNPQFVDKAPDDVVERERDKKQRFEDLVTRLDHNLVTLQDSKD